MIIKKKINELIQIENNDHDLINIILIPLKISEIMVQIKLINS